jgi:hypothetical protein
VGFFLSKTAADFSHSWHLLVGPGLPCWRTFFIPFMFPEFFDYLYHLGAEDGLPMRWVGIGLGLALLVTHLWAWWRQKAVGSFLQAFPRHYGWGVALLTVDAAWAFFAMKNVDMQEFYYLRRWVLMALPVMYVLILLYVKEFLAVRALGALMLLAAGPVLASAFLQPQQTRLLLPVLAYAWIFAGFFFVGMPYVMRDGIHWLLARENRLKIAIGSGVVYGAALLALAVMTY